MGARSNSRASRAASSRSSRRSRRAPQAGVERSLRTGAATAAAVSVSEAVASASSSAYVARLYSKILGLYGPGMPLTPISPSSSIGVQEGGDLSASITITDAVIELQELVRSHEEDMTILAETATALLAEMRTTNLLMAELLGTSSYKVNPEELAKSFIEVKH